MKHFRLISFITCLVIVFTLCAPATVLNASAAATLKGEISSTNQARIENVMQNFASKFVIVKQKQLGGSHYAYTEAETEERNIGQSIGPEYSWAPGSEMVLVSLVKNSGTGKVERFEEVIASSTTGVYRDPDVSADGSTLLYSYKANDNDDFHIYTMNLANYSEITQITFGSGISDHEPKYLPNGKILFSSTRCVQTVDCWHTSVTNMYTCELDGSNIKRLGQDQVHTTYPTITKDGRVIYTRWDYNDRSQMYVQSVFQMFPDGTNQTELYGNNTSFPNTLVHTVGIPGTTDKYYTVAIGHHTAQAGKLALINTTLDRNDMGDQRSAPTSDHAVQFLDDANNGAVNWNYNEDQFGQFGMMYKYPVAVDDNELFVSQTADSSGWTGDYRQKAFNIYYYFINSNGTVDKELICESSSIQGNTGASQLVPVPQTTVQTDAKTNFKRPSMVSYTKDRGTYYIGNVYEGPAAKGLTAPTFDTDGNVTAQGEVKKLRVVRLEFRTVATGSQDQNGPDGGSAGNFTPIATGRGSWDLKQVLGVTDVYEDGSALFTVPADTPVYFQLLNAKGEVVQTMRSWTTIMPGETFSCVGCHENKNSTPPAEARTTKAMETGVKDLVPEPWMQESGNPYQNYDPYTDDPIGFSYMDQVQPVLDKLPKYSDTTATATKVGYSDYIKGDVVLEPRSEWQYKTADAGTFDKNGFGPFGTADTSTGTDQSLMTAINTEVTTPDVIIKKEFNVTGYQKEYFYFVLGLMAGGNTTVKVNGKAQTLNSFATDIRSYKDYVLNQADFNVGKNIIEIKSSAQNSRLMLDAKISCITPAATQTREIIPIHSGEWKYKTSLVTNWEKKELDDSGWSINPVGESFAGDRNSFACAPNTTWNTADIYIRKNFAFTANDLTKRIILRICYDEDPKVYINGTLVYSVTGAKYVNGSYAEVDITTAARAAAVSGANTLAITAHNSTGGQCIDAGLSAIPEIAASEKQTLLDIGQSGWKYRTSATDNAAATWYEENYVDTAWSNGTARFANSGGATSWTNKYIWIRKKFTVPANLDISKSDFFLNTFYDEDPLVYINGQLVWKIGGASYTTGYKLVDASRKIRAALKTGQNTIAVKAVNTNGGQAIDVGIMYDKKSDFPFSLSSKLVTSGTNTRRLWPLSYLYLTDSSVGDVRGNTDNELISWMSSMSGAKLQPAKSFGSGASEFVSMLDNDPDFANLTENDKLKVKAWIDLGVPLCGTYDELNNWNDNERREFREKENKRKFYNRLDKMTVNNLAGTNPGGALTIKYERGLSVLGEKTVQTGQALLNVKANLTTGDKITVTLPPNQKYLSFTLNPRMEESILYCPNGTYTFVAKNGLNLVTPRTMRPGDGYQAVTQSILARVPTKKELLKYRNLALNSSDNNEETTTAYPHATSNDWYQKGNATNGYDCAARNVLDGYTMNRGHGSYPTHSWGTNLQTNAQAVTASGNWIKVDFNRKVDIDKLVLYQRSDFPHDASYTSATVEFDNGGTKSTQEITLHQVSDGIEIKLPAVKTANSLTIKNLKTNKYSWPGFMEVEVYGRENAASIAGTASSGGNVSPTAVKVNTVADTTLQIGDTMCLKPTTTPVDATTPVTWTSSNPAIATVDINGNVTALANGSFTITASSGGINSTPMAFTVATHPESVTLSQANFYCNNGQPPLQMSATISPSGVSNQSVTWTSSNPAVASVSATGLVTFLTEGETTITAKTVDGNIQGTGVMHVLPAPTAVTTPTTFTVECGEVATMATSLTPSDAYSTYTWTSSNPNVATIDPATGQITGIAPGTTTITVTTTNNKTASTTVTIAPKTILGVKLNKSYIPLNIGEKFNMVATIQPSGATSPVTWSVDKPEIVSITQTTDGTNEITAVAKGTAVVKVTVNGFVATCSVTSNEVLPASVSLPETASVKVGKVTKLNAVIAPDNPTNGTLTWSSMDDNIATVDNQGNVTGVSIGTTSIIVATHNGKIAECAFTVTADTPPPPSIIPVKGVNIVNIPSYILMKQSVRLGVSVSPLNATNKTIRWSSSNPKIATVNGAGIVTGVFPGRAYITGASVNNIKRTVPITVKSKIYKIKLKKKTITVKLKKKTKLTGKKYLTMLPPTAFRLSTKLKYTTSKKKYVKITKKGVVTGLKRKKSSVIKIKLGKKVLAKIKVKVK